MRHGIFWSLRHAFLLLLVLVACGQSAEPLARPRPLQWAQLVLGATSGNCY